MEQNPYLDKSEAELDRQFTLLTQAREAKSAALDVAAAAVLKWAIGHLKDRGKLGEAFNAISPQALPKEASLGKPAGFSETQISKIKTAAIEAIQAAAKKA